ncbi:hypothetical protein M885DRAFT_509499 [Pelagophyceae sp. CCMP2097]|nr:hypothetical protein M885DRAFT_509499 [Pelagophyceae sp. CCMP2097]
MAQWLAAMVLWHCCRLACGVDKRRAKAFLSWSRARAPWLGTTGRVLAHVEGIEVHTRAAHAGDAAFAARAAAYVDAAGDALETYTARPGAPRRSLLRRAAAGPPPVVPPPRYTATVSRALRHDGKVELTQTREDGRRIECDATIDDNGGITRVDTYVSPDGEQPAAVNQKRRLVAFGKPKAASSERAIRGLRCRESYAIRPRWLGRPPVVTYCRFGECPAWAGPGKLCALDVTLKRTSLRDLPEHLRRSANQLIDDLKPKPARPAAPAKG